MSQVSYPSDIPTLHSDLLYSDSKFYNTLLSPMYMIKIIYKSSGVDIAKIYTLCTDSAEVIVVFTFYKLEVQLLVCDTDNMFKI